MEGKKGLVEIANGGTLFLDEIGNLPISLQPKLLRLIEESTFRKVGGLKDIRVSLRIIAATNSNIEQAIAQHSFREDLFYRLNVISIPLPPLRHRKDDILLLANYFLHKFKKEFKKDVKGFTPAACAMLTAYRWPGNIRELRNLLEREMIFCKTEWISLADFITEKNNTGLHHHVDPRSLQEVEKTHIEKILNLTGNNKSEAARILGISRTTLRSKL